MNFKKLYQSKSKPLTVLVIISVFTFILVSSYEVATGKTESKETIKEEAEEKVKVDIFQFMFEIKDELEEAAEEYMEVNPNVELDVQTVVAGDDYAAALSSRFEAGNEPAIFNIGSPEDVEDWFATLKDFSGHPLLDLAYEGVLDTVTVDDEVYGLPYNLEGYGFIYNQNIFAEAGINPDEIRSYDALVDAVETLDAQKDELEIEGVFSFPAQETWLTGLHLSNVALANEFNDVLDVYQSTEVEFEHGDALRELVDLQAEYSYQPDGTKASLNNVDFLTQVQEMFALEQVAIIQQGDWISDIVEENNQDLVDNIGILPMPLEGVVEDSIPVDVPMYWAVNSNLDQEVQDEAEDFLNWLYTSETGKDYVVNEFNLIPPVEGYDNLEAQDPLAQDVLAYTNENRTMPWVFMGYPNAWGQDVFGSNIQNYLAGEMNWDELIEDAQLNW